MKQIIGTAWRHYRNGKDYIIQAVAINPNTNERIIVYAEPGDSEDYWRPRDEFVEKFSRVRSPAPDRQKNDE